MRVSRHVIGLAVFFASLVVGLSTVRFLSPSPTVLRSVGDRPFRGLGLEHGSGISGDDGPGGNGNGPGPVNPEMSGPPATINPLKVLSKPKPSYTDIARADEVGGTVILRVTFLASGDIGSISAVKPLPDGLTDMAMEAARGIRFVPATLNGKPVTVTKQVEYTFSIY